MGLAARLPPGVLVALVLTNSCSAVTSLLFLGLIEPSPLSILGTDSDLFEVVAARDEEDDGIMVNGSGRSALECLHES
jgi:hypothetical protein